MLQHKEDLFCIVALQVLRISLSPIPLHKETRFCISALQACRASLFFYSGTI